MTKWTHQWDNYEFFSYKIQVVFLLKLNVRWNPTSNNLIILVCSLLPNTQDHSGNIEIVKVGSDVGGCSFDLKIVLIGMSTIKLKLEKDKSYHWHKNICLVLV